MKMVRAAVIGFWTTLALGGLGCSASVSGGGWEVLPADTTSRIVGSKGAALTAPRGATLEIPSGAIAIDTQILFGNTAAGFPELPANAKLHSLVFQAAPHNFTVDVDATLTLPMDGPAAPGFTVIIADTDGNWKKLAGAIFSESHVAASIHRFSYFAVVSDERGSFDNEGEDPRHTKPASATPSPPDGGVSP